MRFRIVALIAFGLVAGGVITLAVAWACVWWQKPVALSTQIEWMPASDEAKCVWSDVFGESVFLDRIDGGRELDPDAVPKSPIYGSMMFFVMENRWQYVGAERWSLFDMSRSIPPGVTLVRAGWPLHAFQARFVTEPRNKVPRRPIWERGGFALRRGNGMVELPWMPLWPGFAVNTLLFGAIAAGAGLAVRNARRAHRRRRSLCIECAYPRGTSETCSECGANR